MLRAMSFSKSAQQFAQSRDKHAEVTDQELIFRFSLMKKKGSILTGL